MRSEDGLPPYLRDPRHLFIGKTFQIIRTIAQWFMTLKKCIFPSLDVTSSSLQKAWCRLSMARAELSVGHRFTFEGSPGQRMNFIKKDGLLRVRFWTSENWVVTMGITTRPIIAARALKPEPGSTCLLFRAPAAHTPALLCGCGSERRGGYGCVAIRWRGGAICSNFPSYCWLRGCRSGLGLLTVRLTEEEGADSE